MRFGSVCSGIEAASVAWNPLGWKAAWLSEIEPFPSAVLAHHYPDVPNLGDMTTLPERIRSGEVEAPDLFCGGTPCQAFSVAGLRKSLDDARGNLSLTFCEIADAIDESRSVRGLGAAIVFWENVPGVLSTTDNAFGCFLAQLCGGDEPLVAPDGWPDAGCVSGPSRTAAWRVLDAQYFGLAQRRRRVFVIASARDDFDPAAVLFEFDGVRRDTAPSREAGKEAAKCITSRAGSGGGFDLETETPVIANTIAARTNDAIDVQSGTFIPTRFATTQFGDTAGTLTARHDSSPCADRGMNVVAQPIAWDEELNPSVDLAGTILRGGAGGRHDGVAQPVGIFQDSEFGVQKYDSAGTLRAGRIPEHQMVMQPVVGPLACNTGPNGHDAGNFACNQAVDAGHVLPVAFHPTQDPISSADVCHSIGANENATAAVAHSVRLANTSSNGWGIQEEVTHTLDCTAGPAVQTAMQVRRLTPVECERLQGFPDNYTAIPWRKKPASECPDGPRYKALGNSWAVPVVRWIGKRIQEAA